MNAITVGIGLAAAVGICAALVASQGASVAQTGPPYATVTNSGATLAPALRGLDWINVDQTNQASVSALSGHVTVLHFWTFECINCKHNLPYIARWASVYKPSDVQVVGIHTAELAPERDPANVRAAVKELGITYPVLIDSNSTNWDAYHQEAWPTVIVIDKHGRIRQKWVGELGDHGYAEATRLIDNLRKEAP
jgi:thiol-disulfide isomerase/thioredoxin